MASQGKRSQKSLQGNHGDASPIPHKLQRFEVCDIARSQLNPVTWNPRELNDYARTMLRKSLTKFGLVEPLVWNRVTGNLVSGHQRLSILDAEQGYPEKCPEYLLTVAVVELTPKKEKELNVWLNNRSAQGNFERDAFFDLLKDPDITLEELGFTRSDVMLEFGEFPDINPEAPPPVTVAQAESAASSGMERDFADLKQKKAEGRKRLQNSPQADTDYFLMVAFPSRNAKESWLRTHQLDPLARFVNAAEVFPDMLEAETTQAEEQSA